MSTIMSPVEKINNLWIEPWPNRKIFTPEKVARIDDVTVMKLKTGWKLYSNAVQGHVCYAGGSWPWATSLMRCLLELKIITKAQMDEHLSWIEKANDERSRRYELECFQKASEKYGFELTDEQLQSLGGIVCDACGKPILPGDDNVGTECNLHEGCVEAS